MLTPSYGSHSGNEANREHVVLQPTWKPNSLPLAADGMICNLVTCFERPKGREEEVIIFTVFFFLLIARIPNVIPFTLFINILWIPQP